MTDKDSPLRLGVGTVPDPFGLVEEPTRLLSDEVEPDPTGAITSQDIALDEGEHADQSEAGAVRLGELD